MSDTYNTRPGWVSDFNDGDIDHDHRFGVCRVETLEQARASAVGAHRHHWRTCPRRTWVISPCSAPEGRCPHTYSGVCAGHGRTVLTTVFCPVCTARTEPATCLRRVPDGFVANQRRYGAGGPPGWYVKHLYHSPMRSNARDTLLGAARDYNSGYRTGEDTHPALEDDWEPRLLPDHNAASRWW